MFRLQSSAIVLTGLLLSSCGGDGGGAGSSSVVVTAPIGVTPSPSPTPTPSPSLSVAYTRFDSLSGPTTFDLSCVRFAPNRYAAVYERALIFDPSVRAGSYSVEYSGNQSFTAADQSYSSSVWTGFQKKTPQRTDRLAIGRPILPFAPLYARAIEISYQTGSTSLDGVRCTTGIATTPSDLPNSKIIFTQLGVLGSATIADGPVQPTYDITEVVGSIGIDFVSKTIQVDLAFTGASLATKEKTDLGRYAFTIPYVGQGGTFSGSLNIDANSKIYAAGTLFGPKGQELGVAFDLDRYVNNSNRHFLLSGQVFGTQ